MQTKLCSDGSSAKLRLQRLHLIWSWNFNVLRKCQKRRTQKQKCLQSSSNLFKTRLNIEFHNVVFIRRSLESHFIAIKYGFLRQRFPIHSPHMENGNISYNIKHCLFWNNQNVLIKICEEKQNVVFPIFKDHFS